MAPDIRTVGIVGGGFMGSGIAESAARAGFDVRVREPAEEGLERARVAIDKSVRRAVSGGKLSGEDAAELVERVAYTTSLDDLGDADLIVEAVIEDEAVKVEVFRELDRVVNGDTILASNTSSIPIAQVAAATSRRDRVVGLHFFSPVPVMKLVEIVRALDTSDETLRRAWTFVERLGKSPIETKDRSGFVVNMLLVPYLTSAIRMYEEGFATREAIDEGMRLGCGHPMGPLTLCDFIGLDVLYAVCESLYEEFKLPIYAPPPLMKRMLASERLGRKAGRGFYDYAGNGKA